MSSNEQKYKQEAFDLNWLAPLGNNVGLDYSNEEGNSVSDYLFEYGLCAEWIEYEYR